MLLYTQSRDKSIVCIDKAILKNCSIFLRNESSRTISLKCKKGRKKTCKMPNVITPDGPCRVVTNNKNVIYINLMAKLFVALPT